MSRTRIRTALLGSGAAIALLAVGLPASADEIGDLRSQIDAMQSRIAKLEAEKAKAKRKVAAAAAVDAGDKPKSWKLPGTNTSMNILGYAKLDMIYDFGNAGGPALDPVTVPFNNTDDVQGNWQLHARQSRLGVRTSTPTDWGELATNLEVDFYGAGNQTFRMRHAYGRLGPVLAGQTWSTFMAVFYLAETLDFAGPSGPLFTRQAMVRYTHQLQPGTQLLFAVENPRPTGGVGLFNPIIGQPVTGNLAGPTNWPDIIVALHHRFGRRGGIYVSALLRSLSMDNGVPLGGPVDISDRALGWGIHVAGAYRITNRFAIGGSFVYGQGIAPYLTGANRDVSVNFNVTPTQIVFDLESVTMWGVSGWLQFKWTDTVRTNVVGGYAYQDVADAVNHNILGIPLGGKLFVPAGTDHWNYKVHANVIWSPVPQVNFGIEYQLAFRSVYHLNNGVANRIHVGMQYKF